MRQRRGGCSLLELMDVPPALRVAFAPGMTSPFEFVLHRMDHGCSFVLGDFGLCEASPQHRAINTNSLPA
jgi:hypothetical protein